LIDNHDLGLLLNVSIHDPSRVLQGREQIDLFHFPSPHLRFVPSPRALAQPLEDAHLSPAIHDDGRRLLHGELARFTRLATPAHDRLLKGDPIPVPLDLTAVDAGDQRFLKFHLRTIAGSRGLLQRGARVGERLVSVREDRASVFQLFAAEIEQGGRPKSEAHEVVMAVASASAARASG
jgi:hypothetical protein